MKSAKRLLAAWVFLTIVAYHAGLASSEVTSKVVSKDASIEASTDPPKKAAKVWNVATAAAPGGRAPLGSGLTQPVYWEREMPFVDAFKLSSPWMSGTDDEWDDGRPLDLDRKGWVRSLKKDQVARTLIFWDLGPYYPRGKYVVGYEGQGTIEYEFQSDPHRVERSLGRDVIDVRKPSGGIVLVVKSVNPANYIRNIRITMPVNAPPGENLQPALLGGPPQLHDDSFRAVDPPVGY